MGRIVGSFAAATIAGSIAAVLSGATLLMMCGAGPALAGPAAMIARENTTPITASDPDAVAVARTAASEDRRRPHRSRADARSAAIRQNPRHRLYGSAQLVGDD